MRCPKIDELPSPPTGKVGWPWTEESIQLPDEPVWPKISIVTPSFNQGQFIEETIRSVLLQGYPDLEYIVIDGGSADGSADIIRKYERWIAYWESNPDRGQAHAINKGFRRATGEIVAWLNSDDYYEKAIMQQVADAFKNNTDADFIYGNLNIVDMNGAWLGGFKSGEATMIDRLYHSGIPQPSCFWKSSVFQGMGYLSEGYNYVMDYEYWLRCGVKKKFMHIPILLANFRTHAMSKGVSQSIKFLEECVEMMEKFYIGPPSPPDYLIPHKNKALSYWNEELARKYYDSGFRNDARRYFQKAIYLTPFRFRNILLFAYIIDVLTGANIILFLRRIKNIKRLNKAFRRDSPQDNKRL